MVINYWYNMEYLLPSVGCTCRGCGCTRLQIVYTPIIMDKPLLSVKPKYLDQGLFYEKMNVRKIKRPLMLDLTSGFGLVNTNTDICNGNNVSMASCAVWFIQDHTIIMNIYHLMKLKTRCPDSKCQSISENENSYKP